MQFFKLFIISICLGATLSLGASTMAPKNQDIQHVLILLGPPGSGKGTQAKKLTQTLGIPHISTGDLFRENIGNHTELGQKAKEYMNAGRLVPDELVLDMLYARVAKEDCKTGYLLDGFPRTIPQAEAFSKALADHTRIEVINLPVADEVIIKRISGRLSCGNCGNVQNKYYSPPKVEGICDRCSSKFVQREDDKPEVVKERLKVYYEQTAPLIEYYQSKGLLTTVNGETDPEVIYRKIMDHLRS